MPPRYAYWTIIAGGLPTAFRAADRDELMPTFHRIKEKHPDAQMKYFARGKLWESQEEARDALHRGGDRRPRPSGGYRSGRPPGNDRGGRPPGADRSGRPPGADRSGRPPGADRSGRPSGRPEERRGRDWRPGGEHRDPRQKFIDAKKQRNAALRKERWERKKPWVRGQGTEEPSEPPQPDGPNREPPPNESPEPTAPPRPEQPIVPAPGPPERGARSRRPFQPRGRFPKGPRR